MTWELGQSSGSGKACAGHNRTVTVEVRALGVIRDAYLIEKQFRFSTRDEVSKYNAWNQAGRYKRLLESGQVKSKFSTL